jgi:hypothetical protein
MKNIPFQKVILSIVFACMIFVGIEKLLSNLDATTLVRVSSFSDKGQEETKSVLWFISNREEAHTQVQECRMDLVLSHTDNCINAEFAIKIIGI